MATTALGLQLLLPSSSSIHPLWGPSAAAPSLDASGTSPPLLSISVALGVPGTFWAGDCPCQPQHAAGCVPGQPPPSGLSQTADPKSSGNEEFEAPFGQEDLAELVGSVWSLLEIYVK